MTKEFSISSRFSPAIFDPDANSVLLQAHLCTAADSARRKPCVEIVKESVKVCTTGVSSRTLYAQHPVTKKSSHLSPVLAYEFLSRCKISTPTSTPLYSSIDRLYAQNPVFEIVHEESVKVHLHMYNGNVQQNPLCVESCVTKEVSISPRFSPTILIPMQVRYSYEYTFVQQQTLCAENPVFEIVQEIVKICITGISSRTLYVQHPVAKKSSHLSPVLAYDFLSRCKFSTPTSTPLYISINRLYAQNPVFETVREESVKVYLHMYNGNVQQNSLCVESCVTKEFSISPRFSPTIFDPDANSVLLRAHLCTAVVIRY